MMRRFLFFLIAATVLLLATVGGAYFSGWYLPNDPGPTLPVRGIDVSHHQGLIDWKAVAASGIRFAYIKATEGGDYQDERFRENVAGANAAGIPCGAYHYLTLNADGARQAEHFYGIIAKESLRLPPVIDVEVHEGGLFFPDEHLVRTLGHFRHELAMHGAPDPVLYTSGDYIRSHLRGMKINTLWLRAVVWTPESCGFPNWKFWQYSERGCVPGIGGFVDMDVFHGSSADFADWLKEQHP